MRVMGARNLRVGLASFLAACALGSAVALPPNAFAQVSGKARPPPRETSTAKIEDVSVTIGKPRHWTLDDAHYLLADMHKRARGLTIKPPGAINSDAVQGARTRSLQSRIELSGSYSELVGLENEIKQENLENAVEDLNTARADEQRYKQQLEQQSSTLLGLKREKAQLQAQSNGLKAEIDFNDTLIQQLKNSAGSQTQIADLSKKNMEIAQEKRAVDVKLNQVTAEIALVEAEVSILETSLDAARKDQSNLTSQMQAVTAPALPELQTRLNAAAAQQQVQGETPNFPPSVIIDNYIDAETVALAKKLTLLRSEIGDDKTVVFLELPQSIQTADRKSDNRHVQVIWKIEQYCTGDQDWFVKEAAEALLKEKSGLAAARSLLDKNGLAASELNTKQNTLAQILNRSLNRSQQPETKPTENSADPDVYDDEQSRTKELERFVRQEIAASPGIDRDILCVSGRKSLIAEGGPWNGDASAWDLIPKSDAYNISDLDLEARQSAIGAVFSFLTGIGLQASFRRTEEQFERFKTQDVFASAFGQGAAEFGWVFNPKPGTDRISSGPKSTYATLTVPRQTSLIRLSAVACVLRNTEVPFADFEAADPAGNQKARSRCTSRTTFDIPVDNYQSFWIDKLNYTPVDRGDVISLLVQGSGFSPFQMSVLVDGTPLSQFASDQISYSVDENSNLIPNTQAVTRVIPPSSTTASGYYQVMNSGFMSMHFRMPASSKGTPDILIVSPSKTVRLNNLSLTVNGQKNTRLRNVVASDPLFRGAAASVSLGAEANVSRIGDYYSIILLGQNLQSVDKLVVNGLSGPSGCDKDRVKFDPKTQACSYSIISDTTITLLVAERDIWPILIVDETDPKAGSTSFKVIAKPGK